MQRTLLSSLECIDTLSVLCLSGLQLGEVPAAVQNLCHLTELDLEFNCLTAMPVGPYLARLQELYLDGNRFKMVPLEIYGAAGTLETLFLDMCDQLEVQLGAPDKLRCMQRLRMFSLVRIYGFSLGRTHEEFNSVCWSRTSLQMIAQLGKALPHTCFDF